MEIRNIVIGFKVRPRERVVLERKAEELGASGISELIRHALDAFLGTDLAAGNLKFAADRPRRRCRRCHRVTTHLYGEELACGKCYRDLHQEIGHGGQRKVEVEG
jgi:Zn finger protein HypA/HybF involved in hydrogenase expression